MSFPRYPQYKDSGVDWLGQVPAHWDVCALKRIIRMQSGESITAESIDESGDYPVFGGNGLRGYTSEFTHDGEFVLIGRQGALCGNINYAAGKFWASEHAVVATPIEPVATRWLGEMLRAMNLNQYSVSAAQPGLSVELVGNLRTVCPPLPEQREIAGFLDRETGKIDALVAEQERLLELLKEKRQAVISHAVTRGLNPNAPLKPSEVDWIGAIPTHWETKKLRYLCDIQTGDKDTENLVADGEYPFFVRSQTVEKIDSYTFDCEAILTAGDGAGVGKVFHHYQGRFDFHQRVYMMNNFRGVSGAFLFHYLRENFYKVALEGGAKSTVDSLRRPVFTNFPVCVPPLTEQRAIVAHLDAATAQFDALTAEVERALALLQERRTALISAAVTGQIDVRAAT